MTSWTLERFIDRLDAWVELEHPPDDVRRRVTAWVFSRYDDPYQGVRREVGFDNLWYGTLPGSLHGDHQEVMCAYWIVEATHSVVCESFATLSSPV